MSMAASEMLRARVDPALARRVDRWAKAHGTDISGTIRIALARLLEQEDRQRKVEAALREVRELAKTGVFEPGGRSKAGGFR
jgi:predicted transcriptional regulator